MREKLAVQAAQRIIEYIRDKDLQAGYHLVVQELADLFDMSRAPVNAALKELSEAKIVYSEPYRGFFVTKPIRHLSPSEPPPAASAEEDKLYALIAEDRLNGRLPDRVSENELIRRYGVPRARLQLLLTQITEEGWVERRAGHGWQFGSTLTSGEAYGNAYRFRAAIEAYAVLQPAYTIDPKEFETIKNQQVALLNGEMFTLPRARLFDINTTFHETIVSWSNNSFFLDAIRRVNRLRRLMEYRVTGDRSRLKHQCDEHLTILEKLEAGDFKDCSAYLHEHIARAWSIKEGNADPRTA